MAKSRSKPARPGRRGWATLWLIIWLPALLALFCALVAIANLWLARVEAENAMEAAALAAVKQWGDANGGDTLIPRQIGQAYAAANCVRKVPVTIGTNYDPADGPNQNAVCPVGMTPPTGNLIFGSIRDDDPNFPGQVVFNAGVKPGCGAGLVIFDVTGQGIGGLDTDAHNEWGIAFHPTPDTPAGLRIEYIIITLPDVPGINQFDPPNFTLSDNTDGQWLVRESPVYRQPDIQGFSNPAAQITASYPIPSPNRRQLRIDFSADGVTDLGFEPCDRFRFGQSIDFTNDLSGNLRDADGVGEVGTTILVHFNNGSESTGTYVNTTEAQNDCEANPSTLPCPAGAEDFSDVPVARMVVHPAEIDDLPCPPGPPPNNGQSYGSLTPGGSGKFGVRAQSILPVSDFGCVFLGTVPQGCVTTKSTAVYDCITRRPSLIRIDVFICPGPDPADGVIICDFCAPGP